MFPINSKLKLAKLALTLIFIQVLIVPQSLAQTSSGEVIEKAMADELKRSMEELKYEDYEKPFFMSYQVEDVNRYTLSATLGALVHTNHYPSRSQSVRILVGNYELNDESLDVMPDYEESLGSDLSMPLDDDYFGIRRSLWATTNDVYKSAAKLYRKNQQQVEEKKKNLSEIPHRRFIKTPTVQISQEGIAYNWKQEELEALVRELSALFKEEADIDNSIVSLNFAESNTYFLNSEGTKVKYPTYLTTLLIMAESKTEQGESIYEQTTKHVHTPADLPSGDELKKEVNALIERLHAQKAARVYSDSYIGPVLFTGESVGAVFSNSLFGYERLIASNDISSRYDYGGNGMSLEDRIGKKVIASEITVKSLPRLKTYKGTKLLGSFEVDGEGVVPPDELILIEEGNLLNLLNSRTATTDGHVPNGHSISNQQVAPGVIEVSTSKGNSLTELKQKLISLAKEEGLSYAIMVKEISYGNYMMLNIYKVSLEDGSEELLRMGQINALKMKSLRNIKGISSNSTVYHSPSQRTGVASYIVPDGLLLEEVEVTGNSRPFEGSKDVVENPLKASRQKGVK